MPKRKRPVEMPVPSDLRDALLELAVEDGEVTTSVKALVEEARSALSKVNAALASSSLAGIVVREMVRANKKRGSGTIRADARGVLTLYLGKEDPVEDVAMPHTTAPGGAGLPSLDVLRDLADQRGVDISDLGRRKRDIMRRIADHVDTDDPEDEASPPHRLRDEVRTGHPLPDIKLPR